MRFDKLDDWLDWQQTLNPAGVELGLQRVRQVTQRLGLDRVAHTVITVAGTNGKGSTVAGYETWLHNAGYRVASYTSPHLLRYNERIKLNLQPVSDSALCAAFDRVDQARKDIPLTYFEFGTLAALDIFHRNGLDYAVLEVGLGGRLDAVNVVDPDLAHITNIGLDHQQWLGDTREQIGSEKAGILRSQALAVCNDRHPPQSVLQALRNCNKPTALIGEDYDYQWLDEQCITWSDVNHQLTLQPPLPGRHQAENVSGVLAGLSLLGCLDQVDEQQAVSAFDDVQCAGRLQVVEASLNVPLLVDVGHNADAARMLADELRQRSVSGRVIVILGMLEDKDPYAFSKELKAPVDEWWCLSLDTERGLSAQQLSNRLVSDLGTVRLFDSVDNAMTSAMSSLNNQDILLVTGSFLTVEAVLKTSFVKSG